MQSIGFDFGGGRCVRQLGAFKAGGDDLFEGGAVGVVLVLQAEVLPGGVHQGAGHL
ncbi:hypothetical protein WKI65_21925 [Streptomyces sp. MS1.AVA.3]|uniref:hypothetical protein n=1 Tax=Streptomyces decoyicus TaxID=249567 RepID=UPI0030C1B62B